MPVLAQFYFELKDNMGEMLGYSPVFSSRESMQKGIDDPQALRQERQTSGSDRWEVRIRSGWPDGSNSFETSISSLPGEIFFPKSIK